jgi:phosphonatase-like hydrolase
MERVEYTIVKFSRRQSLKGLAAAAAVTPKLVAARRTQVPAIRLVVFDVGGTLIEDRGNVPKTLGDVLSRHGISSSAEEINRWRGASKRELIAHFVERQSLPASADRAKLTTLIHDEFTSEIIAIYRSVPPITGVEQAIRQLRDKGYLVATTTGFNRAITESIFRRLGWNDYFAATICSDDVSQGRPSPFMLFHAMEAARVNSVNEVVAVGDTPLDLQVGSNAGLRAVIGVLSGVGTTETLRREPHTHILQSAAGIPSLLASKL